MAKLDRKKGLKCTATNERFGASGGVARPKVCDNEQVLRPAQTAVSRHLPPSRRAL
jgi:hypothetical protein